MKKVILTSLIVAMVAGVTLANPEGTPDCERVYKLNIIGVDNPKNKLDQGAGNVIFVNLNEPSKISLVKNTDVGLEEDEYAVLDKDATDSDKNDPLSGAILALPDPDLTAYNITTGAVPEGEEADTESAYSIYIRSLGAPGGSASITTCAELLDTEFGGLLSGKFVSLVNREGLFGGTASIEQVAHEVTLRPKGKSIFTEVTAELLTIVFQVIVDLDGDLTTTDDVITEYVRVPIFDDLLKDEYWEYDNDGLKLLQVWFYACGVDVSENDLPEWK
jgi:hypothetical protein